MSSFQSMLGETEIDTDTIYSSTIISTTIITKNFQLTGGALNQVLTSDSLGNGTWQYIPLITLVGDASGPTSATVVNSLAGGTIPVSSVVTLTGSQTLTYKTLTNPQISVIQNGPLSNLTVPSSTIDTFVCRATTDSLSNKTLIQPVISSISNGGIVTIPSGADTLVNLTGVQTLVNKTLSSPRIASIINVSTLTLPASLVNDTLVARTTLDTLTNKTLITPVISSISNGGIVTIPSGADTLVTLTASQTLINKTLTGTTNSIDANTLRNGSTYAVSLAGSAPSSSQVLTYNGTNGVWQNPVSSVTMAGDVTGNSSTSVVNTLAGGTLAVGNLVTLSGTQTLSNKNLTGTTNSIDANTLRNGSTYAVPLAGSAPATNNVLTYNGTNAIWQAPASTSSVTMGGDVTGNSATSIVSKINGTAVSGASNTATVNTLALRDSNGATSFNGLTANPNTLFLSNSYAIPTSLTTNNTVQVITFKSNTCLTMDVSVGFSSCSHNIQYVIPSQYCNNNTGWCRLIPKVNVSWDGVNSYRNSGADNTVAIQYVNFDMSSNAGNQNIRMIATTLGNSAGTATISFKFSGVLPASYNTTIGSTVTDTATYP